MLTSLQIRNFKAWKDTSPIRLAPLTVIFGANSAGKSSLGHLLLALKQTVLSADRKRPLHLGDETSLIDLGTFTECLHDHDPSQALQVGLGWQLPERLEVRDPINLTTFSGDALRLDVRLQADRKGQAQVRHLAYGLYQQQALALQVAYDRDEQDRMEIRSDQYALVCNTGHVWPLEPPDKFYRISDQSRARFQNAEFLSDFALRTEAVLNSVHYLGPVREYPRRLYSWSGETPDGVGQKGESAIAAILAAAAQERMLSRGPKKHQARFDEFIAHWLKDLGMIDSFAVRAVAAGRKEHEVLVKTHAYGSEVKITDVGFGVSQVLPALVQAFYCPPDSTAWIEQPEIHLHPQVQAELADVFIAAVQAREDGKARNAQLIVESHSEHFLNRLQRRVAEGALAPDEVAVYFCRRAGTAAELEPLRLNIFGEIENWPEHFFGNEMADISGRTLAAMQRQIVRRKDGEP